MMPLTMFLAIRLVADGAGVHSRQPQLAVGEGLVAVTFGSGNAIYFAASTDHGRSFSQPAKVAEVGSLSLGHRRGPRIAITPGAIVISAVTGQLGGGRDGNVVAWRSTDRGKLWSPGVVVNDVSASAREGLHAMASGGKGLLFATWLDLRHRQTELYGARSTDGGATWSKNILIYQSPDGHICECCHPSVLVDAQGSVYAMWRNWTEGARDMYLARSTDGGAKFLKAEKLGEGTWPLQACPMDGGGIAVDSQGHLVSLWRRASHLYLARPGQQETLLGTGKDGSVAWGPEGFYIAWSSGAGLRYLLPGKPLPVLLAEEGASVHLAGSGPVFAAWESKGAIIIQTLP